MKRVNIEVIPAIDLIAGECVRLSQGDYQRKSVYFKEPLDVAKQYEEIGIRRLHLVDLDGAKEQKPKNLAVLERIVANTSLKVQYGGGIKSRESLSSVFSSGARWAICGSIAVTEPDIFRDMLQSSGEDTIILGADIKDGFIATHGWLKSSEITIEDIIEQFSSDGLRRVICTDISKDGMLQGPTFELYERLQKRFSDVDITVSGGISSVDDILRLDDMSLRSVVVGKAIYEGHITMEQLKAMIC